MRPAALPAALCALGLAACGSSGHADRGASSDPASAPAAPVRAAGAVNAAPTARRPLHTYYVSRNGSDGHSGSKRHPWRTIGHAAAHAGPGSVVRVGPGSYRGPVALRRSGTAGRRISFVSTARWQAKISATSSESLAVVAMDGDYVDVEGFDISGRGGDGTVGIAMQGSHQRAIGNDVHDVLVTCDGGSNGGAGIVAGSGNPDYRNHDLAVVGNLVHGVVGTPKRACAGVQGIYAAVPRVSVVNNVSYDNAHDCISSWHAATQLTIVNNTVADCPGAGITVGSGETGAGPRGNHDTYVANNIVSGAHQAIIETTDGDHPMGPRNRYVNNLVFDSDPPSAFRAGADLYHGAVVTGTVTADPRFVGGPRGYRLAPGSPAIDAGTGAGAPRTDFDRVGRPQGRHVDIGAFEYRASG
jgi:hypothetical protein